MFNLKKLLLLCIFTIASSNLLLANIKPESYKKTILSYLLLRAPASDKYQKMVDDISRKFKIESRQIKAYNFGILLRLLAYHNAAAIPAGKMIIINEDVLKEMPDELAEFLIAHELAHHKGHKILKQAGIFKYMPLCLNPEACRPCEIDADTKPVTIAKLNPDNGIKLLKYLENPDTKNWPVYAKINILFFKLTEKVLSIEKLKFLRTHPTFSERIRHLESLKSVN